MTSITFTFLHSHTRRYDIQLTKALGDKPSKVYSQICYYFRRTRTFVENGREWHFVTQKEIADKIGCSVKSVYRAINKLIEAGIIIVKRFSSILNGRVNCYALNITDTPVFMPSSGGGDTGQNVHYHKEENKEES